MSADATSAIFPSLIAAAGVAVPGGGVAVAGFEALLASLFGDPNAAAAGATPKTAPAKGAAGDAADAATMAPAMAGFFLQTPVTTQTVAVDPNAMADPQAAAAQTPAPTLPVTTPAILGANLTIDPHAAPPAAAPPSSPAPAPAPAQPVADAPANDRAAPTVVASTFDAPVAAAVSAAPVATAAPADPATPPVPVAGQAVAAAPTPRASSATAKSDPRTTSPRAADAAAAPASVQAPVKPGEAPVVAVTLDDGDGSLGNQQPPPHEVAASEPGPGPAPTPVQAQFQAEVAAANPGAAAAPPRAGAETVKALAEQMAGHLGGKSTQFDIALDPAGLGKVDVRVQIGADGALTAAMAFATPHAASELRARAAELQQALQQAGFDIADGALSFDVTSQGGGSQGQANHFDAWQERTPRTPAFADIDSAPLALPTTNPARAGGVDIRI